MFTEQKARREAVPNNSIVWGNRSIGNQIITLMSLMSVKGRGRSSETAEQAEVRTHRQAGSRTLELGLHQDDLVKAEADSVFMGVFQLANALSRPASFSFCMKIAHTYKFRLLFSFL